MGPLVLRNRGEWRESYEECGHLFARSPIPGTTAAQARLQTECFNASTKTWRTTGNCANVGVETNGMPNTVGTEPVQPMPPTANPSAPYPGNAAKLGISSKNPGSLKDQASGSAVNSTPSSISSISSTSSTSSSLGR